MLAINYIRTLIAFVVAQVNTHTHTCYFTTLPQCADCPSFSFWSLKYGKQAIHHHHWRR